MQFRPNPNATLGSVERKATILRRHHANLAAPTPFVDADRRGAATRYGISDLPFLLDSERGQDFRVISYPALVEAKLDDEPYRQCHQRIGRTNDFKYLHVGIDDQAEALARLQRLGAIAGQSALHGRCISGRFGGAFRVSGWHYP